MQVVSPAFYAFAQGPIRPLSWAVRMSFDKTFDDTIEFFELDTSLLDGGDILAPNEDNPIQAWDYYNYLDYTSRIQMVEWSREIEFPYSVTSAMADFTLDNHDDYFTPNGGSPIDSFILPKRPVRILSGFNGENIPQFVGLTQKMPVVSENDKTASFHALDFLSQMFTMKINTTIAMRQVRTDEVLDVIFQNFGLHPSQYNLAKGRNVIPFLFFEKGVNNAGDVFRQLMQAEMGNLWLDEKGIIQFTPRIIVNESIVYTFTESSIVEVKTIGDENIINTVHINAEIREVQPFQPVYTKSESDTELFVIAAGGTREFIADLEDPCISIVDPTIEFASSISWFTANLPSGVEVTSGVTVTATELRTNSFAITFSNSNGFSVNINRMELWGEPAKIIDRIDYTEVDQDSIDKYEEKRLDINNNFIGSISQCDSIALTILDQYAEHSNQLELEIKGSPALQMNDIVTVVARGDSDNYKMIKILNKLNSGRFTQVVTVVRHTVRDWFILDESLLDGSDLLTP